MRTLLLLTLGGLILVSGVGLVWFSGAAQKLERKRSELQSAIDNEHDHLKVLHAEWGVLTAPERLAQLARTHLPHYAPLDSVRIVAPDDLEALLVDWERTR